MRAKKNQAESFLGIAKPLSLAEIKQSVRKTAVEGDRYWDKFTLEALKKDCAFFAREVLTGPNEAPYSGHFILGDHHLEWSELLRTRKRICVLAARGHGKCASADAYLLRSDGVPIQITKWEGGELIAWDQINRKLIVSYAPPVQSNGIKKTLKIITT